VKWPSRSPPRTEDVLGLVGAVELLRTGGLRPSDGQRVLQDKPLLAMLKRLGDVPYV